jgi:glycosyltransferase involved in cell wall biosynthesis
VVTIHDGIDIGQLEKSNEVGSDIRKEFEIPTAAPILCEIGNIRRWKGQHVAIRAMQRLVGRYKDARLFIIGEISNSPKDLEYLKELKALAAESGVEKNVVFTGYRKDALNFLVQSDVMVHTSIIPEPMGRVVLEGMVFRKPVIATNHGGPVEILEDGKSGFLVEPGNPEALAERISFLLENKEAALRIGEAARQRVAEKFDIGINMKKLEEVYDSLLLRE